MGGDEQEGAWGTVTVTRRCCGGGTCRNLAPSVFAEVTADPGVPSRVLPDSYEPGAFTGVVRQPDDAATYHAARTAAAACGFAAIRITRPKASLPPGERGSPWGRFPRRLEGDVWVLGQPSTRNYGALAYFIVRPGGGILVDLPKPSKALFEWLEAHGGVAWIVLTHADHAQHHAEYAGRFPAARRVIGAADVSHRQNPWVDATADVEVQLPNDLAPLTLDGAPIPLADLAEAEVAVLPQPGHTPGSICLLYRGRFLFTGDHLAWSAARGHLIGHRLQCWESWERQTRSVAALQEWADAGYLRFGWVLPGHGEWLRPEGPTTAGDTARALAACVDWMRGQPPGNVPLLRWIPFVQARARPGGRFERLVWAIGGPSRDAWLLPPSARAYLTDFTPSSPPPHLLRLAGIGLAVVAGFLLLVGLAGRLI